MVKETYEKAELEIIAFDCEDIITASKIDGGRINEDPDWN